MKLALFAPNIDENNGVSAYALAFESAMSKLGVEVVRPFLDSNFDPENAVDFLNKEHVDIAHFEMGGGRAREFLLAERLASAPNAPPISITVHDPERIVWRLNYFSSITASSPRLQQFMALVSSRYTLWRERRLARKASALIALTDSGRLALTKRMGLDYSDVVTIPHGCWLTEFKPVEIKPMRLLSFGYLYRGKGLEDLLKAVASFIARRPEYRDEFRLTFAGGTNPELTIQGENSYISELKALASELKISELVDYQTDIPDDDIPLLIQSHSVVILPYQQSKKLQLLGSLKGASGALARALGCGRGVISSNARAFPEEIARGIGEIYEAGNTEALCDILIRLFEEPERAARWSELAKNLAEKRSWENTAQHFYRLYSKQLKSI